MVQFQILCEDSLKWLKKQPDRSVPNYITGIPDLNELGEKTTVDSYTKFFTTTANGIFRTVKADGYCLFIQTDRKIDGQLFDKSYLLTDLAKKNGFRLLFHKIVCQRDVGKTDLFRPTYSHYLGYSISGKPGAATPDILPVGEKSYDNATPSTGAEAAATFISTQIGKQKFKTQDLPYDVVDPFVGQGTIGIYVMTEGLSFLGLDIDPKQCQITKEKLKQYA